MGAGWRRGEITQRQISPGSNPPFVCFRLPSFMNSLACVEVGVGVGGGGPGGR